MGVQTPHVMNSRVCWCALPSFAARVFVYENQLDIANYYIYFPLWVLMTFFTFETFVWLNFELVGFLLQWHFKSSCSERVHLMQGKMKYLHADSSICISLPPFSYVNSVHLAGRLKSKWNFRSVEGSIGNCQSYLYKWHLVVKSRITS